MLKLKNTWAKIFEDEFKKPYIKKLEQFLKNEAKNYTIYPKYSELFSAFDSTDFYDVKVVIIGQDPYHGVDQAHGLSFSVQDGVALPPSLRNIFKELVDDLGCEMPKSGNLTSWANGGVLLLNRVLSVRQNEPTSHENVGWEQLSARAIKELSLQRQNLVFILWGSKALALKSLIDNKKHLILSAPHPSPLSSYRGFFGSKPFSKTNEYLKSKGVKQIKWCM